MIKNIVFDFGGVILKHKAAITTDILSAIFPDRPNEAIKIYNRYKIQLQTGKKTSDDFILELKNQIPTNLNISEIKQKWLELYKNEAKDVDWGLLDYIEKLKTKYKVYLFSDTLGIHDEYNKTRNIYNKFDRAYKSFEEGVAKSEGEKAFIYLLDKIQARPDECIFIDDLEANVQIAQKLGIKAILYQNLQQLKKEIKLQRLLIS